MEAAGQKTKGKGVRAPRGRPSLTPVTCNGRCNVCNRRFNYRYVPRRTGKDTESMNAYFREAPNSSNTPDKENRTILSPTSSICSVCYRERDRHVKGIERCSIGAGKMQYTGCNAILDLHNHPNCRKKILHIWVFDCILTKLNANFACQ